MTILVNEKAYQEQADSVGILAVLRGTHLRFEMKTKEILLGRPTKESGVDVNLLEEFIKHGHTNKISRKQACIEMKTDGWFYIKNLGKALIFTNGKAISKGQKKRLLDNSIIEICSLQFIFEFKPLFYKIRSQIQS